LDEIDVREIIEASRKLLYPKPTFINPKKPKTSSVIKGKILLKNEVQPLKISTDK
jgi:hypothetical protein